MGKSLKAIYENGVFRPLEPVSLPEHQEVVLAVREKKPETQPPRNSYELAKELGLVGIVTDAPEDLSTNKDYFEGFGAE